MFALLALATVQALVQVAYLRPLPIQLTFEVGFTYLGLLEKRLIVIALGFQLDVVELAQDNRLVGEGPIIALIGKRWRFDCSGCVVYDDRYTGKRFLCPAISTDRPEKGLWGGRIFTKSPT